MLYCRALLPRTGLANRLFPWARCLIFSHLHQARMLAPTWAQVKLGPLLRREKDPRFYHNLFKTRTGDIRGLQRLWIMATAQHRKEPENFSVPPQNTSGKNTLVTFEGTQAYFRDLNGWNGFLSEALSAITRKRWLEQVRRIPAPAIGIHVRRGDFRMPLSPDEFRTSGSLQIPIHWYIESVKVLRRILGATLDVRVFSDGTQEELQELLQLERVSRGDTGSAVGDLLGLSKSKILIASGSTFSAWASFLGQMPTLCCPGQLLSYFHLTNGQGRYLGDFDPAAPSEAAIRSLSEMRDR